MAQHRGTIRQVREEMKRLVDYCQQRPDRFDEVLPYLTLPVESDAESLRIFGEVLVKGRGQTAEEIIGQTALAWSRQNRDQAKRRLGAALLAQWPTAGTNSVTPSRP